MLCIINVMQKIVNVLAVASSVVSLAVVGGGFYLFVQKDAIINDITEKALDSVLGGGVGGLGGGAGITPELPLGTNDLAPTAPQSDPAMPSISQGVPSL